MVTLDGNINIQPGEYVFVWIPGVGEKPFSCLTDAPLRLAVIDVGQFTSACYKLQPGDDVYIRGPHGAPVMPKEDANIICVAGGTGLAAVYQIATDDGSAGFPGRVPEALRAYLETLDSETLARTEFYNCGPEPMIHAAEAVQRDFVDSAQMFSAIDYTTKCGVGICGACASPDGRRICVDGLFASNCYF